MTDGRRRAVFAALVAACVIAVAISMVRAAGGDEGGTSAAAARAQAPVGGSSGGPVLVYRSMDLRRKSTFGRVVTANAGATVTGQTEGPLACDRVAFSGGRGICLHQRGTLSKATSVKVLDDRWRVLRSLNVDGIPSRTRVSPGGRLGALTTFVAGHAYGSPGSFSTSTVLLDLAHGRTIGNLESFTVELDGHKVAPPDRNFWGATFAADEDTFYATFATGHHHYLVRGSVRSRRMTVLRDNVECPSLSPTARASATRRPSTAPGASPCST